MKQNVKILWVLGVALLTVGLTLVQASQLSVAHASGPPARAVAQWIPIDVGTLGGWTNASDVNDSGQVVGLSETLDGRRHAYSWTRAGGLVDLGTLGGSESVAVAVNNKGQVVGWSQIVGNSETHAFFWSVQTGMIDLGTLGGRSSNANGLNDSGQVVGASGTAAGRSHAFLWTQTGGMIDLHVPDDGRNSAAGAVNSGGQVIGFSSAPHDATRGFSWTAASGMVDLTFPGTASSAAALNDSGQVVGSWYALPFDRYHAFSWTEAGGLLDLGTLDRTDATASDVNARGRIVGSAGDAFPSSGLGRPHLGFFWAPESGMVDVGGLGGASHADAVNDDDLVVGDSISARDGRSHAFAWTPAIGMRDLGTAGQVETGAWKVNERGEIMGYSIVNVNTPLGTEQRGLLWEPIANLGCSAGLAGCNLKGVALAGAYLAGANLSGANLKGADFRRANLAGADLTDTNLKDVDFSNATLAGAHLEGANVRALWSNTICPDGTNSDSNAGTCIGHLLN